MTLFSSRLFLMRALPALLYTPTIPLHSLTAYKPSYSTKFVIPGSTRLKVFAPCNCSKMPPKVSVEYAKSARSSCKKCANTIDKGALRLGSISKGAGGFDVTRWYHVNCFPPQSEGVSPENISGFSSLKVPDQEAIKVVVASIGKNLPSAEMVPEKKSMETKTEKGFENDESNNKKLKTEHPSKEVLHDFDISFLDGFSPSELKTKYKDVVLPPKWKTFQTVIILGQEEELEGSQKIAAFDFDGCLANTSLMRVGADAWSLQFSTIPEKLQSYYNEGFKVVIFTNESNIDRWKNSRKKAVDSKLGRLEAFIEKVKIPIQVFVACGMDKVNDPYRKPKPGMWWLMAKHFNSGVVIDMEQSFYVGDAAGRSNDHSDADLGFAKAIGLKFFVPEDIFS